MQLKQTNGGDMARILVTGASSGIGEATVRKLRQEGHDVIATARRQERLDKLAQQTGCQVIAADLTKDEELSKLVRGVLNGGPLDALVNNAGGARGSDAVADGKPEDWRTMYEINVMSTLRLTQALLPGLRKHGGDVVFVTSTAAHETYMGGAGYTAAKHAEAMIPETMRLELVGEPVRIIEVCPGMVKTEEFSLNRLGSTDKAMDVYAGVDEPLLAEDIADVIAWTLSRPKHVNIDRVIVRPVAQANSWTVARTDSHGRQLPTSTLA